MVAHGTVPITGNTYDNYGPAYVMLVSIVARLLGLFLPWITSDLRHLVYFVTFVVGLCGFPPALRALARPRCGPRRYFAARHPTAASGAMPS